MRDLGQQSKVRRAGIPKGDFCRGCGGTSTGIHLDHGLLPAACAYCDEGEGAGREILVCANCKENCCSEHSAITTAREGSLRSCARGAAPRRRAVVPALGESMQTAIVSGDVSAAKAREEMFKRYGYTVLVAPEYMRKPGEALMEVCIGEPRDLERSLPIVWQR